MEFNLVKSLPHLITSMTGQTTLVLSSTSLIRSGSSQLLLHSQWLSRKVTTSDLAASTPLTRLLISPSRRVLRSTNTLKWKIVDDDNDDDDDDDDDDKVTVSNPDASHLVWTFKQIRLILGSSNICESHSKPKNLPKCVCLSGYWFQLELLSDTFESLTHVQCTGLNTLGSHDKHWSVSTQTSFFR